MIRTVGFHAQRQFEQVQQLLSRRVVVRSQQGDFDGQSVFGGHRFGVDRNAVGVELFDEQVAIAMNGVAPVHAGTIHSPAVRGTLTSYARRFITDPAGLRTAIDVPVLFWEAPPTDKPDAAWMGTETGSSPIRPRAGEPLVLELRKGTAQGNPFAMGITVGRIDKNDLVVDDTSVSRFHAYFQRNDRTHKWWLTDADSKNGTFVEGQRLKASAKVELPVKARLRFGDVHMHFFEPDAFFMRLETELRSNRP